MTRPLIRTQTTLRKDRVTQIGVEVSYWWRLQKPPVHVCSWEEIRHAPVWEIAKVLHKSNLQRIRKMKEQETLSQTSVNIQQRWFTIHLSELWKAVAIGTAISRHHLPLFALSWSSMSDEWGTNKARQELIATSKYILIKIDFHNSCRTREVRWTNPGKQKVFESCTERQQIFTFLHSKPARNDPGLLLLCISLAGLNTHSKHRSDKECSLIA
jgi:hypothetical protein